MDKITIKIFILYLPLQAAVASRFEKIRSERSGVQIFRYVVGNTDKYYPKYIPQVYPQGSLNFHLLHFYPPYPYPHRNVHLLTVTQSV